MKALFENGEVKPRRREGGARSLRESSRRRDTRLEASRQPSLHTVLREHHVRFQLLVEADISHTSALSRSAPALSRAVCRCLSPDLSSLPAATAACIFQELGWDSLHQEQEGSLGPPPSPNRPYSKAASI